MKFDWLAPQFPISEIIHGPYLFCVGRFETDYNPMHPGVDLTKLHFGRNFFSLETWIKFYPNITYGTQLFWKIMDKI
jgi:hypothetical protein